MRINHVLREVRVLFCLKEVVEVVKMMESKMIGINLEPDRGIKLRKLWLIFATKRTSSQMATLELKI